MQFLSVVCDLHPISPPPPPSPDHAKQTNLCSKTTVFVKNLFMFEYIFKEIYQFFFFATKIEHAGFGSLINRLISCLRLGK